MCKKKKLAKKLEKVLLNLVFILFWYLKTCLVWETSVIVWNSYFIRNKLQNFQREDAA